MQRITLSIDDDLAATLDRHMKKHRYASRSEALRDILREAEARERLAQAGDEAFCIATLAYVYDHETRELGRRITEAQHRHHDHESCLEVAVLRGPVTEVRALADETISQRGVRHGQLHLVPAVQKTGKHAHGKHRHEHVHIKA